MNFYSEITSRSGENLPHPRLDGVKLALSYLSNPQDCAPVIHVTGTNGKTTVSRMVGYLLTALGLRVGLFTSPHIQKLEERIQIDMKSVDTVLMDKAWRDIQFQIELADNELTKRNQSKLTFFECITVLAFSCFADAPVDVMVLEVGMGGAWDATNVVDAEVCVFTPIDFDHTDRLGNSLEQIANTKAGIIKPHSFIVSAKQHSIVARHLREYAACIKGKHTVHESGFSSFVNLSELPEGPAPAKQPLINQHCTDLSGANLSEHLAETPATYGIKGDTTPCTADGRIMFFGQDFHCSYKPAIGGQVLDLKGIYGKYCDIFLPLFGAYQAQNASLALAAVESFIGRVEEPVVSEGFSATTSPGRLQVISRDPLVLLDAAHNPHAAKHLAIALNEFFAFRKIVFLLAFLSDKDIEGIIRNLMLLQNTQIDNQYNSTQHDNRFSSCQVNCLTPTTTFTESSRRVTFVITQSNSPRAANASTVFNIAKKIVPSESIVIRENIDDAFDCAMAQGADAIVICGTISILGSFISGSFKPQ